MSATRPMRDLAVSMLRFGRSSGRLGASLVGGSARHEAMDTVSWAARDQLGDTLQALFLVGEDLGADWLELMSDAAMPWRWQRAAAKMMSRSRDALRFAETGAAGAAARQELRNKLEVFRLVKGARRMLDTPPRGQEFELREYVERAYALDAYQALWAIEGLGHDYAQTALLHQSSPRGLLTGEAVAGLPDSCLAMLHGGLGLAFAEHLLNELPPSGGQGRELVERFVDLCRANASEKHLDIALEALGLETRCFFPHRVSDVGQGVATLGDSFLEDFFWHGVGRAIYFLPVSFVPGYGSFWNAIKIVRREVAGEESSAVAGVAFAFTMVNMGHPEVLEQALRDHGAELEETSFSEGVAAAVVMRHRITPDSSILSTFLTHTASADVEASWERLVRQPCDRGSRGREFRAEDRNEDVYRTLRGSEVV